MKQSARPETPKPRVELCVTHPGEASSRDSGEALAGHPAPYRADRESGRTCSRPLLVLVTGVPGSGKTTLAAALNDRLGFALLSRDDFRVRLWNLWQDQPDLLPQVPKAHWAVYYATLGALLDVGVSVVAEGSVHTTRGAGEIGRLLPGADAVVIHCVAPRATTHERFRVRAGTGRRNHPAYTDAENLRQMEENPARWAHFEQPVALDLPTLTVDTGSGYQPDLESILEFVRGRGKAEPRHRLCAPGE